MPLACLNNDPDIQPHMGPKCNPVGGEPPMPIICATLSILSVPSPILSTFISILSANIPILIADVVGGCKVCMQYYRPYSYAIG